MRKSVRTPSASRRKTSLVNETRPPEAVVGQRESGSGRVKPADSVAVGVHLVAERPDDVTAALVFDLLRLVEELGALGVIELRARLRDQVEELGILPVRLVERGVRQAALVDLAYVDRHARALRLLRYHLGRLDDALEHGGGDELDAQVALTGLPQERLRPVEVLAALRQVLVVGRVVGLVEVVGHTALA